MDSKYKLTDEIIKKEYLLRTGKSRNLKDAEHIKASNYSDDDLALSLNDFSIKQGWLK